MFSSPGEQRSRKRRQMMQSGISLTLVLALSFNLFLLSHFTFCSFSALSLVLSHSPPILPLFSTPLPFLFQNSINPSISHQLLVPSTEFNTYSKISCLPSLAADDTLLEDLSACSDLAIEEVVQAYCCCADDNNAIAHLHTVKEC